MREGRLSRSRDRRSYQIPRPRGAQQEALHDGQRDGDENRFVVVRSRDFAEPAVDEPVVSLFCVPGSDRLRVGQRRGDFRVDDEHDARGAVDPACLSDRNRTVRSGADQGQRLDPGHDRQLAFVLQGVERLRHMNRGARRFAFFRSPSVASSRIYFSTTTPTRASVISRMVNSGGASISFRSPPALLALAAVRR